MKLQSVISVGLILAAVLGVMSVGSSASAIVPRDSTSSVSFIVTTTSNYPVTTGGVVQVMFDSIQLTTPPPQAYAFGVVAKTFPGLWITRLLWQFGDGAFVDSPYCCQNQVSEVRFHSYAQTGSYTVVVVAYDSAGNIGDTIVTVGWPPPPTQALFAGVDSGQGSVSPNCPGPNGCQQVIGSPVAVAAIPAPGWLFSTWGLSGAACSGGPSSNPCAFTMPNNAVTVSASFTQPTQALFAGVDSGQGSVSPNCPGPNGCQQVIGSPVSIAALAPSGWSFSAWSVNGASCSSGSSSNPCTFTMPNNAVTVSASFTQVQTLITDVDSGQGSVSPNCSSGCSEVVGSSVTVSANPATDWQFSSWSTQIGVSCSSNPCTFTMPNNQVTLKATFTHPVPGFPLESIIVGTVFGLVALGLLRRHTRP